MTVAINKKGQMGEKKMRGRWTKWV